LRIFFANNYPMLPAKEGVEQGTYPRAHLWGADALADEGLEVVFVPSEHGAWRPPVTDWLEPVTRRLVWHLGDLGQELFVLPRARRGSVVYGADQVSLRGLALLRSAGLFPAPIVAVIHHPIEATRANRAFLKGLDFVLCLSHGVQQQLISDFGRPPATTQVVPWGPDLSAPFYSATGERFVVSTGKTQRDVDTLLSAVATADYPVRIYSRELRQRPGAHVEIVTPHPSSDVGLVDYLQVMDDLRDAAVVAIPISNTGTIVGLTELNDALALGKPVVMTRNDFIDVDIEAIGCGIWVAPGDVAAWRQALDSLMADPARRRAMGAAGRAFADRDWNYDLFCQQLLRAIARVHEPRSRRLTSRSLKSSSSA
jgi:glycosyltransferase involved in cell wall biosynthesis